MKRFAFPLLLPCAAAFASPDDGALRSVREVNDFLDRGHGRTNFVLSAQLINDPADTVLIVRDGTGRTAVSNRRPVEGPRKGDLLRIRGFVSVRPNGETWTEPESVDILGSEPAPAPADIGLDDLNKPENAWLPVRVAGTVYSVMPDEFDDDYRIVLLSDGGVMTPVFLTRSACDSAGVRPDATVRLSGFYWRSLSGIRKYTGPAILHDPATAVETLAPPPDDPFAAPPLERRFYRTPEEIARMGPRTVSGRVVASWGNGLLMTMADDNRIVNVSMLEGHPAPPLGETGVFVGYPYTDLMRVNLMRARFRHADLPAAPEEAPMDVDAAAVLADRFLTTNDFGPVTYHGKTLRLRGIVRSLPQRESPEQRIYLDCGGTPVPVDISACRGVAQRVTAGCEVGATGRCLLETESWRTDNVFPHVRGFALIARTPDDVRVTKLPSWWTPRRLASVIGISLAGLAVAFAWIVALLRLAERRGRALYRSRQAEDAERHARETAELRMRDRTRLAVELHDTISQTLTGATLQMGTAAQLAGTDPDRALRHIDIATRTLESCREDLRNCIWDLRSNTLDEKDLNEAVRRTVRRFVGDARLDIRLDVPRDRLSDNVVHALMNVVRELATNAVRHGGASRVSIAGTLEVGSLSCSVEDDGRGFDPDARPGLAEGHFGLQGVEERIAELGGELSIRSRPGEGTNVSFRLPVG